MFCVFDSDCIPDIFIAHIGSMDVFAKGLLNAAQIKESGRLAGMVEARYASWKSESFAQSVITGQSSFDALERVAIEKGHPTKTSGKQGKSPDPDPFFCIHKNVRLQNCLKWSLMRR